MPIEWTEEIRPLCWSVFSNILLSCTRTLPHVYVGSLFIRPSVANMRQHQSLGKNQLPHFTAKPVYLNWTLLYNSCSESLMKDFMKWSSLLLYNA